VGIGMSVQGAWQGRGEFLPANAADHGGADPAGVNALERERARLARELHDGPAQLLTNLALQLELVERLLDRDPAQARAELWQLRQDVRAATEETRRVISNLAPAALTGGDLTAAVAGLCDQMEHRFGLLVHRQLATLPPLPAPARLTVFRVVQEALQNVLHHSGRREAWVTLAAEDGAVVVEVRDAGVGFDPAATEVADGRRLGLIGMRERARLSAGSLSVKSRPGRGVRVRLRIPLAG